MKKTIACLSVIILLASCSSGGKKVFVISEGSANINTDDRTITVTGTGHEEKEVMFYESGNMELKLTTKAGNATATLTDNGVYILNAKTDTIVGSFVNYTAPKTVGKNITEEEMRANVDSLQQILSGNVKYGKTYYILPNQAVKITDNQDANIITPYHQMTSVSTEKGKTPEVYRFYMISEVRNTLQKLKNLMGEGDQPVNDPK
jgi:hypothetical protein